MKSLSVCLLKIIGKESTLQLLLTGLSVCSALNNKVFILHCNNLKKFIYFLVSIIYYPLSRFTQLLLELDLNFIYKILRINKHVLYPSVRPMPIFFLSYDFLFILLAVLCRGSAFKGAEKNV